MRNDLKKKAKLVADEAYGLTGMKAQQKQALATWLTTCCSETLKDDVVVNVPNFIFPVVKVVWVDGQRGNKSSYVDSAEASTQMSEVHGVDTDKYYRASSTLACRSNTPRSLSLSMRFGSVARRKRR